MLAGKSQVSVETSLFPGGACVRLLFPVIARVGRRLLNLLSTVAGTNRVHFHIDPAAVEF